MRRKTRRRTGKRRRKKRRTRRRRGGSALAAAQKYARHGSATTAGRAYDTFFDLVRWHHIFEHGPLAGTLPGDGQRYDERAKEREDNAKLPKDQQKKVRSESWFDGILNYPSDLWTDAKHTLGLKKRHHHTTPKKSLEQPS